MARRQAMSPEKPDANGDSASPPATEKRSSGYSVSFVFTMNPVESATDLSNPGLRHAPTPRQFYAPETTPHRVNPPRSASQTQQQQQNNSSTNGDNGTAHFPTFQTPVTNAPIGRPVATPRNAPHEFLGRAHRQAEMNGASIGPRFGAGHQGSNMMQRIVMGLKSGIPSEIDFGLSQLVRISFEAGDDLHVDHWPGLTEMLFERLQGVEQLVNDNTLHGKHDTVVHSGFTTQLEKINEAALILRNMCMHVENARKFAGLGGPKDIMVMCLQLPNHPSLVELKNYILDMVEAMANCLPYLSNDPLFDVLVEGLESDDRGILLGSLKSICRLVMGRDELNLVGEIPLRSVSRVTSILMVEDDELVSTCLDFLYQYTTNDENIQKLLQPPVGYELVRHLGRLLLFQGITGEQLVYIKTVRKQRQPSGDIPGLPQEIVNDLLGYTEPERATKWMRCCFEEDPDADITQIALWQAYQARFNEFVTTGLPLLPAAEFIKNVSVAFTTASAMVLPTSQGQKFIIKGIRARETPMNTKGHIYLACRWFMSPGNPNSECRAMVAHPQDLWAHVLNTHLPPPPDGTSNQQPLLCNWAGCTRFGNTGENVRLKVVAHVRTHMPNDTKFHTLSREEQEMMEDPEGRVIIRRCQTQTDERGEAGGIPLTSVLVLRNLKRRGGELASRLLKACHEDFYEVMAVNKPLANYVSDLLLDG
ncbi:hypothetical protein EDC01DRAFT_634801 [Geopyxis carbonaria]|nr:hypothetical protein EDC01DRAFT_634801 [Geopyxis carbonaria]